MRLKSVSLHNIGSPFKQPIYLDIDAIPGLLVAFVGENGAGKSTLLEAGLPGVMYRDTPTRGSLLSLAIDRDCYVESEIVNGKAYKIRQTIGQVGNTPKGTSYVEDADGKSLLSSTNVSEFDRWAKDNLPSSEVLYASIFGAQGGEGNILDMKEGDRKAVILRSLGIEKYETMARAARERAAAERTKLESLAARIKDEEERGLDLAEATLQLTNAKLRVQHADLAVRTAAAELATAKEKAPDLAAKIAREEAKRLKADQLKVEATGLATRFGDLDQRVKDNELVIRDAASIRGAAARLPVLAGELATLRAQIGNWEAGIAKDDECLRAYKALREQDQELSAKLFEHARRVQAQAAILADAAAINSAAASLPLLAGQLAVHRSHLSHLEGLRANEQGDLRGFEQQASENDRRGVEAWERIVAATKRLTDRAMVHEAAKGLDSLRLSVQDAAGAASDLQESIDEAKGSLLHGAERRIATLRPFVDHVAAATMTVGAASDKACDVAREDDFLAKETELAPEQIAKHEKALGPAREKLKALREELQRCEIVAARVTEIEAAEVELRNANDVWAEVETNGSAIAAKIDGARSRLAVVETNLTEVAKTLAEVQKEHERLTTIAARAGELAVAEARIAEIEIHVAELEIKQGALRNEIAGVEAYAMGAEARIASARENAQVVRVAEAAGMAEHDRLSPVAGLLTKLEVAVARLAELTPQRDAVQAQSIALREQIIAIEPDPGQQLSGGTQPEDLIAHAQASLERTQEAAQAAHGMIAVATARIDSAELSQRKLAELNDQRSVVESDLSDWVLLGDSLGRDGLQVMEIDCAGPELTELTNDLLRTCFGTRWTASFVTTRENRKGDQIEDCDIRVFDSENGREGPAKTLSGGEKVVVGEAVSLGLAMLNCRRSGMVGVTLIRDESGAALSQENSFAYIKMLRRAAQLVGASKVLLVSHSPQVQALCDARVLISDGALTVKLAA